MISKEYTLIGVVGTPPVQYRLIHRSGSNGWRVSMFIQSDKGNFKPIGSRRLLEKSAEFAAIQGALAAGDNATALSYAVRFLEG